MKNLLSIFALIFVFAAAFPAFAADEDFNSYTNVEDIQATDEFLLYRPGAGFRNWLPTKFFIDAGGNAYLENTLTLSNTGLHLFDTDGDADMIIKPGTDYTADRTLTLTGPNADLTLTLPTTSGTLLSSNLKISQDATNTAGGTTGNQTINKPTGTVNFAAGATALTVTNSLVTTSSIVLAVVRTNDATAQIKNVVPGSGSFVINLSATATGETSVGFIVIN